MNTKNPVEFETHISDRNLFNLKKLLRVLPKSAKRFHIFSLRRTDFFCSQFHSYLFIVCAILTIQRDLFCLNLLLWILRDTFFKPASAALPQPFKHLLHGIRSTLIESICSHRFYIVFALWKQPFPFVN